MVLGQHPTRPGVWAFAVFVTLLLHVGVVLGARALRPLDPSPGATAKPDIVQVVFAPEPEPAGQDPTFFSELPPDRGGETPDRPDFLSNVDSRARDNAPGGTDEDLPKQEGESEAPHIRMDTGAPDLRGTGPEEAKGADAEPTVIPDFSENPEVADEEPPPQDSQGATPPADEVGTEPQATPVQSPLSRQSLPDQRDPLEGLRRETKAASDLTDPSQPGVGSSDLFQESMSNRQGNTLPYGDISLNTIAWDYAPWLQEFRRKIIQRWRAPYGYYLGVIHGWTHVEIEIARSGELLRMDVLGEEGHESLKNASVGVLRAAKPYRQLPDHFPEESLILRIKLIYPERRN